MRNACCARRAIVAAAIAVVCAGALAAPSRGIGDDVLAGGGEAADLVLSPVESVGELVPAPTQLAQPAVCGDVTVYDTEDVETLCSTEAATPITSPTCPQVVTGSVRLETDLVCTNTDGLVAGSDNVVIDLNGHSITCVGGGYFGSCQGDAGEAGVWTNNFDNVHVFSNAEGGTIDGFDFGVFIDTVSDNVKVKQLRITGPVGAPGFPRPPGTVGILVNGGDHCRGRSIHIGGGTSTGNDVSNHRIGIDVILARCVFVGYNTTHHNRDWGVPNFRALGILIQDSSDNHVRGNVSFANGDFQFVVVPDAGILVDAVLTGVASGNLVVENQANDNQGAGIGITRRASGNYVVNNQMLGNFPPAFDARSDPSSVNDWNENNRCVTQTTPQPQPGVCGPDEFPPPQ